MDSSKKLYIALAVLVALGGGVYLQQQQQTKEERSHSLEARAAELPKIEISEEVTNAIDTVEIIQPAKDAADGAGGAGASEAAASEASKVVLTRKGEEDWDLVSPVSYKANASNVKSLLNNLKNLKVTEQIASTSESYDKWGVSEAKGLRAVFKKGEETVLDVVFGDSGSRGQMTRIADKEGVYALQGYSKYLYARDVAGWRDKTIFKFEDKEAVKVTIENENGTFEFEKTDDTWSSSFGDPKTARAKQIEDFKASKVDDMLRAYKSLSASSFGDDKALADVGLVEPIATVTIELQGGSGKHVLYVGNNAEGTNRWVRSNARDTIFSISSWAADWATADTSKFQDKKEEAPADRAEDDEESAMPMPMPQAPHSPH